MLSHRKETPNWLNQTETFQNVRNLSALLVELRNGGRGWVTYHADMLQLTRIIIEVTAGDPTEVAEAILNVLHQRHKRQDAIIENIFDEQIWAGCQNLATSNLSDALRWSKSYNSSCIIHDIHKN